MVKAVGVRERYDRLYHGKECTRRELNTRVGRESPELIVPEHSLYLWDWFYSVSARVKRITDGICYPISPSEIESWIRLTKNIVYSWEYDILCAMDDEFCSRVNEELIALREEHDSKHS